MNKKINTGILALLSLATLSTTPMWVPDEDSESMSEETKKYVAHVLAVDSTRKAVSQKIDDRQSDPKKKLSFREVKALEAQLFMDMIKHESPYEKH